MVRLDDAQFEALFFLDSHFSEGVAWFFLPALFDSIVRMKGTGGKTGPVRTLILRSSLVEYMNQHFFLCFFFLVVFFCGQTDGVFDPLSPSPSPSSMSFISLCFLCDFFLAGGSRSYAKVCVCVCENVSRRRN